MHLIIVEIYLMKTEYFLNEIGPVAKHNSTVPAKPGCVVIESPSLLVTSSLHFNCKNAQLENLKISNYSIEASISRLHQNNFYGLLNKKIYIIMFSFLKYLLSTRS